MAIARLVFFAVLLLCPLLYLIGMPAFSSPVICSTVSAGPADLDKSFLSAALQHFCLRGDWEPPDILLLADNSDWRDSLEIIVAAAYRDETPVYILSGQDDLERNNYLLLLNNKYGAQILRALYNTPWIRDYGPIQLKTWGNVVYWLDFNYAEERPHDDSVPQQLAGFLNISVEDGNYYLDGGAIISNGKGLCAMTIRSLEEASVDPASSEEFNEFSQTVGCRALAVLPALTGESTGHADIIAQFLAPDIVAVAVMDNDESSGISAELDQAVKSLAAAANAFGQPLRIVRLPMHVEGEIFYSYVNGTRLRKSYLAPSFKNVPPKIERKAYQVIRSVIPEVILFPVPADVMVEKGGAVHCITLGLDLSRPSRPRQYWIERDNIYPLQYFSSNINTNKKTDKQYEDKETS